MRWTGDIYGDVRESMSIRKTRKPTIKEVGQFAVDTYNYVRQLEMRVQELGSTLSLYLEMNGDLDKLNQFVENKVADLKESGEKPQKYKKRKKKPAKRSRATKTGSKAS